MLNISITNHSNSMNDTSGSEDPYYPLDTALTKDPYCPLDTPLTRGTKTAAYVIQLLMTVLGNVLVIHIIRRNPTLRSTSDLLIVNMCVSDLLIPFVAIPNRIKMIYVGAQWIGGDLGSILCKLVPFATNVTITVSILSMLAIAVDRFRAIVYPTKPTLLTASSCRRLIALIWILSALTYPVFFYTFSSRETGTKTYCTQRWYQDDERDLKANKIYFTSLMVLLVVTPKVLITALYTAVVVTLHQQKTRMASHLGSEPLRQRTTQNRKITLMLITVVVVFVLAYVPFEARLFLFLYIPRSLHKLCFYDFVSLLLTSVPGAVNPVIYFTFNNRYLQGLRQLICSKATSQTCSGCPASSGQENGNNACAVVVNDVSHEIEMQEIG